MILKMQIENFKSYGGVKEIGPFHKCFSSVVGPNGSGKSNVIDAMLFVFGKKTNKLRMTKVRPERERAAAARSREIHVPSRRCQRPSFSPALSRPVPHTPAAP